MLNVLFDQGRDEEVAVVALLVPTQDEWLTCGLARNFEDVGVQLLSEKLVIHPLVTSVNHRPERQGTWVFDRALTKKQCNLARYGCPLPFKRVGSNGHAGRSWRRDTPYA